MAQSVATLAQADKEFQDALAHLHKPGRQGGQQDPALAVNLAEGGVLCLTMSSKQSVALLAREKLQSARATD